MDTAELIARYPRLYHMAEDGSWPSIQAHGLLSTRAMLDHFEVTPDERRHFIQVIVRASGHLHAVDHNGPPR
jgi:hypothetical protein